MRGHVFAVRIIRHAESRGEGPGRVCHDQLSDAAVRDGKVGIARHQLMVNGQIRGAQIGIADTKYGVWSKGNGRTIGASIVLTVGIVMRRHRRRQEAEPCHHQIHIRISSVNREGNSAARLPGSPR